MTTTPTTHVCPACCGANQPEAQLADINARARRLARDIVRDAIPALSGDDRAVARSGAEVLASRRLLADGARAALDGLAAMLEDVVAREAKMEQALDVIGYDADGDEVVGYVIRRIVPERLRPLDDACERLAQLVEEIEVVEDRLVAEAEITCARKRLPR